MLVKVSNLVNCDETMCCNTTYDEQMTACMFNELCLPRYTNWLTCFWLSTNQIAGFRIKSIPKSCIVLAPTAWASYQIRKVADAHAPGIPGTFSLPPRVNDPDMHHGTCVTHVPWCMPGSLTSGFLWRRWRGKTFPAFPAHAQPSILRIWQESRGNYQIRMRGMVFTTMSAMWHT